MNKISYGALFSVTLVFILTLVLASGCAAPQTGASTSAAPGSGPRYGGTLKLTVANPPVSMDPVKQYDTTSHSVAKLYTCCLVRYSGKNDFDGKIVPWLAKSWEESPDGLTYTFHLNEGVKWQNLPPVNGREVTSEDVAFSINRVKDPKTRSPLRPFLSTIERIETPDKYTVRFVLNTAKPGFVQMMAPGSSAIFAREVIEKDGDASKTFVGCGPFMLEEYQAGVKFLLRKNPDYFEKGRPYLDRIEMVMVPDESARIAAFRAGQTDRISLSKTQRDDIVKTVPGVHVQEGIGIITAGLIMGIGYNKDTWGKAAVRQAVRYAIDYDGLIQAALDGAGMRTDFLSSAYLDWGARPPDKLPGRDIVKAKGYLAEAGYPKGFKTTMLYIPDRAVLSPPVEPVVAMLKEIGIDVELKMTDTAGFVSQMRSIEFDLGIGQITTEKLPDPDMNLYDMYHTGTMQNRGYNNPRVDELLDLQRKPRITLEQRKTYIREVLQILDKDVPVIPLFMSYRYVATQSYIKGWVNNADPNEYSALYQVPEVWLEKK